MGDASTVTFEIRAEPLFDFQFITNAANRHDDSRSFRIFLDLVPKRMDMDIQSVKIEGILLSPHAAQHGLTGKGLAGCLEKALENGKFFWRQRHQLSIHPHFMLVEIHLEIPHPQYLRFLSFQALSTKERTDLRHQLPAGLSRKDVVHTGFHVSYELVFRAVLCAWPERDKENLCKNRQPRFETMKREMKPVYEKQRDGRLGLLTTGFLQAFGNENLIAALLERFTKLLDRGCRGCENDNAIWVMRHARDHNCTSGVRV